MRYVLVAVLAAVIGGCTSVKMQNITLHSTVKEYFEVYAQREEFDRFMGFYSKDAILKDVIYGNHLQSKKEITEFMDWHKGSFERVNTPSILTVQNHTIDGNKVVTEGYFHKFRFNNQLLGPWLFIMVHEFDEDGLIIHQTDWINYTPKDSFGGELNLNNSIR